jgi:cellulose synthase/poly-beta-1,6-N-acetylglucosamine synthase-like glycosyltransferase
MSGPRPSGYWSEGVRFKPVAVPEESLPKVSIHVAAYNEPPEMVIETLNALAALDYPRFEVIVIDNNSKDRMCGSRL